MPPHANRNTRSRHRIAGFRIALKNKYGPVHSRNSHATTNSNLLNGNVPAMKFNANG